VEEVADNAWDAIHGEKVHYLVGKTARKMRFAAKWMPSQLRKRATQLMKAHEDAEG